MFFVLLPILPLHQWKLGIGIVGYCLLVPGMGLFKLARGSEPWELVLTILGNVAIGSAMGIAFSTKGPARWLLAGVVMLIYAWMTWMAFIRAGQGM
jgi:hypothetical protein